MYRGQMSEIKHYGFDKVLQYCVDTFPVSDLETKIISGNHDESWFKSDGADIVRAFAGQRDDITYLGFNVADVIHDGVRIRLLHPEGGGAYAKSYVSQKYIR